MLKGQKLLQGFCLLLFVLATTLGAFVGSLWGSLGIGGGVLLYFGAALIDKKLPLPPKQLGLLALLTLAVWAAELPLSSNLGVSVKSWLHLASVFLPLLLLLSTRVQTLAASPRFSPVIAMAMAIGVMALGLELALGGTFLYLLKDPSAALSAYNRGVAHTVILAFPVIGGLWALERKRLAIGLALLLFVPATLTISHTARLALILGMACTAVAFLYPLIAQRGVAAAGAIVCGWPFFAQHFFAVRYDVVTQLPASWRHRMEVWDYLSYRIAERPVFGWGLGATNTLDYTQPHGELYRYAIKAVPHAHNAIVQLWVETGLPGLALGLAFLLLLLTRAGKLHASLRPFAFGGIAAALTISLFGFNFWTDALWAAFALSAFVFGVLQQNCERKDHLIHA